MAGRVSCPLRCSSTTSQPQSAPSLLTPSPGCGKQDVREMVLWIHSKVFISRSFFLFLVPSPREEGGRVRSMAAILIVFIWCTLQWRTLISAGRNVWYLLELVYGEILSSCRVLNSHNVLIRLFILVWLCLVLSPGRTCWCCAGKHMWCKGSQYLSHAVAGQYDDQLGLWTRMCVALFAKQRRAKKRKGVSRS